MRSGLSLKEECEIKRKEANTERQKRGEYESGEGQSQSYTMSRDRGGGRDRRGGFSGNRTDSEDPKLLNARVFIGNLASDKISREELEEKFKKYGYVTGVTMFRGYGFVQFDREPDARKAVDIENGGLFKGQRMDVKMAAEGRNKSAGDGHDFGGMDRRGRGRGRGGSQRHSSPPPKARRLDPEFDERRPPRDGAYGDDPYRRDAPRDPYFDRARDDPYRRDPYPTPDPYRDPFPEPLPPPGYDPLAPIDCVIFTLGRHLEAYAEIIVRQLREFGMVGSILPLADENSVKPAMEDVTERGSPFAIVLNDQNEAHQSCTVSILHGVTQEHRNMPLADAIALMRRSFETFLKAQREKAAKEASSTYQHLPPGAQMQYLLNLLADNHHLTADELTKVIAYLEDRRKTVIAHEGGVAAVEQEKNINKQQQELQAKILSILGPDSAVPQPVEPVAPPQPGYNSSSVQHAIDTLMQSGSDLLQNLAGGAPPPPPEPAAPPPLPHAPYPGIPAPYAHEERAALNPYAEYQQQY